MTVKTDKPEETTALSTVAALDDFLTTDRPEGRDTGDLGTEHIGRDDVTIPRLGVGQKTSPELDPTNPRYIDGVQFTDMYNSVSKTKYGKGPLHFAILRAYPPRYVEFVPMLEGGGVKDRNVPANDPRTLWGAKDPATGKQAKPLATLFYDYIILLLTGLDLNDPMQNVMALSLKSSEIAVAKQLNMLMNQRAAAGKKAYKGVYTISSSSLTKGGNTYAIRKVDNAGWLKPDSAVEKLAATMFEQWKDRDAKIDLEHSEEIDDSMAANGDRPEM